MGNRMFLLVAVLCVGLSLCWGEEDATHGHGARNTFSESLGSQNDNVKQAAQNLKNRAEDAASRATETVKSAASGASDYASQKATDAQDTISDAMSYETIRIDDEIIRMPTDAYEDAKHKMYASWDKHSTMARNAKDNIAGKFYDAADEAQQKLKRAPSKAYTVKMNDKAKGAVDCGSHKASGVYDEAKERMAFERDRIAETFEQAKNEVSDKFVSAKNTMSEEAKAKYEAAKEKASDATGDLGEMIRNTPELEL